MSQPPQALSILSAIAGPSIPNITLHLDFWMVPSQHAPSHVTSPDALGEGCQSLVLIYDSANSESFEFIKQWGAFIRDFNPSVLLCVANEVVKGNALPSLLEMGQDWAIDNGMEFVQLPHQPLDDADAKSDQAVSPSTTSSASFASSAFVDDDDDDDDKGGCERLIEALHANMWEVMTLKPRPGTRLESKQPLPSVISPSNEGASDASTPQPQEELKAPASGSHPPSSPSQPARDSALVDANTSTANTKTTQAGPGDGDEEDADADDDDASGVDLDIDGDLSSFEAMFDRVRAVRSEAMQGQLTDQERRDKAAQVIFAMMQSMGLGDGDDDELEDGEDSS